MTLNDTTRLLVLGPMRSEDGKAVSETRTTQLVELVKSIVAKIGRTSNVTVDGPDNNPYADIIPGIMAKIERADLAICDLTNVSGNVMYEVGLVNALGLPFINVTSTRELPFYMAHTKSVTELKLAQVYDPEALGHKNLLKHLKDFLDALQNKGAGGARPEHFATNPVSAYFDDLPIVDISAPTGLAAGYWNMAVRRFAGEGGYFQAPKQSDAIPKPKDGIDATLPMPLKMGYFIAVYPADSLQKSQEAEWARLLAFLETRKLCLVEGKIPSMDTDEQRPFFAKFLARKNSDGTYVVIKPGIVVDIPTTLFALQYSPRIMTIRKQYRDPADRAFRDELIHRRYKDMMARFERVLHSIKDMLGAKGFDDQVQVVTLEELPALLDEILPG